MTKRLILLHRDFIFVSKPEQDHFERYFLQNLMNIPQNSSLQVLTTGSFLNQFSRAVLKLAEVFSI